MTNNDKWVIDQWTKTKATVAVRVNKHLKSLKTKFQKLDVYQTKGMGKMLLLDDIIMLTEFDEFAYHEMIVHPAFFVHPNARKVLVIGGGDGGTPQPHVFVIRKEN